MQPSPKDYQDFAFGLLPANADGQAFATPDTTNGLWPTSAFNALVVCKFGGSGKLLPMPSLRIVF
jgi:hypothetical protein